MSSRLWGPSERQNRRWKKKKSILDLSNSHFSSENLPPPVFNKLAWERTHIPWQRGSPPVGRGTPQLHRLDIYMNCSWNSFSFRLFLFYVMVAWGIQAQLPSESPLRCGRNDYLWGTRKWKFLFRDAINAEGSLLIQRLYWSFWTFQLQINVSYILSQPPNWHLNTCDIYTYTPQLFLPDCLSSHLLPFLFFSSPHLHSAVVPQGTHIFSHLSLTILSFYCDSFNISL